MLAEGVPHDAEPVLLAELLAFLLTAGATFELVGRLEKIGSGLETPLFNFLRRFGMRRQVEQDVAGHDFERAVLLAHSNF